MQHVSNCIIIQFLSNAKTVEKFSIEIVLQFLAFEFEIIFLGKFSVSNFSTILAINV